MYSHAIYLCCCDRVCIKHALLAQSRRNTGSLSAFVSVTDVSCSGCGTVAAGGDVVLFGSSSSLSASSGMGMGSTGFPTNTEFNINGQTIELHTSCSRPLGVGTTVGQLTLVEFVTSARTSASCGPPPPPACVNDLADCPVAYCPFCVDRFRPLVRDNTCLMTHAVSICVLYSSHPNRSWHPLAIDIDIRKTNVS